MYFSPKNGKLPICGNHRRFWHLQLGIHKLKKKKINLMSVYYVYFCYCWWFMSVNDNNWKHTIKINKKLWKFSSQWRLNFSGGKAGFKLFCPHQLWPSWQNTQISLWKVLVIFYFMGHLRSLKVELTWTCNQRDFTAQLRSKDTNHSSTIFALEISPCTNSLDEILFPQTKLVVLLVSATTRSNAVDRSSILGTRGG